MFRYRKLHWFISVVLVSLLALDWFSNKPDATTTEKICGLIGITVVWGIFLLIFVAARKLIDRSTGRRFQAPVGAHVLEISDDVFTDSNANGKIEIRPGGIRHIAETPTHFFILTTTGRGHVIPKRDLQSLDAIRSLQSRVTKGGT